MFLKYRVLRYVRKKGITSEKALLQRYPTLGNRLSSWSNEGGMLVYYGEGRLAPGSPASFEITELGLDYIETLTRELALMGLSAFLGALLGALLAACIDHLWIAPQASGVPCTPILSLPLL